jgi:hypothetical protein
MIQRRQRRCVVARAIAFMGPVLRLARWDRRTNQRVARIASGSGESPPQRQLPKSVRAIRFIRGRQIGANAVPACDMERLRRQESLQQIGGRRGVVPVPRQFDDAFALVFDESFALGNVSFRCFEELKDLGAVHESQLTPALAVAARADPAGA